MKLIELYESERTFNISYYMQEGCGTFAYAMSKVKSGKIVVLMNPDGESWSDDIPFEVTHVVFLDEDKICDAKGYRSIDDIKDDFHCNLVAEDTYTPEVFKNTFTGDSDEYPLYNIDESDMNDCIAYIKANPKIFGLNIIQETATAGATGAGSVAVAVGGIGAGFDPSQTWRSFYEEPKEEKKKGKKNVKALLLKR